MANISVSELIPLLQIAISPVILISGVGLLLLFIGCLLSLVSALIVFIKDVNLSLSALKFLMGESEE